MVGTHLGWCDWVAGAQYGAVWCRGAIILCIIGWWVGLVNSHTFHSRPDSGISDFSQILLIFSNKTGKSPLNYLNLENACDLGKWIPIMYHQLAPWLVAGNYRGAAPSFPPFVPNSNNNLCLESDLCLFVFVLQAHGLMALCRSVTNNSPCLEMNVC